MTINHNYYLDLAFQQAEKNLGQTSLHPSVGTVTVKNGTIISSGVTSLNGRPHSEFNALKHLNNCSGATLYTTLEPCSHHGKTPPCVQLIANKRIKRVFFSVKDPDIRSYNKCSKKLKKKGIYVKSGIYSFEIKKFYKSYFLAKKKSTTFCYL